jgi:GH35 family endo-1,4-beta-xylanase
MVAWAQENDIQLRGHCVFWEDTQTVQPWVRALDNTGLKAALDTRLNQVRSHVSLSVPVCVSLWVSLWISLGF